MRRLAYIFAFAALVLSCAKEEEMKPSAEVRTYEFSLAADRQEDEALAKALSLVGKTLTVSWNAGDALSVYNCSQGAMLEGSLVTQNTGKTNVCFSGSLTGVVKAGDILELRWNCADYKNQDGTLDYIATHCDHATAKVTVSSVSGNRIKVNQTANFEAHQAILKLFLKQPDGTPFNASLLFLSARNVVSWKGATRVQADYSFEDLGSYAYDISFRRIADHYEENGGTGVVFIALPEGKSLDVKVAAVEATSLDTYTKEKEEANLDAGKYYEISMPLVAPVEKHVSAPAGWKSHIFDDDLFYEYIDSTSGVKSYYLKNEVLGFDNSQTLYFTGNEFTDDERFLVANVSMNEWSGVTQNRKGMVIDLATRKKYIFPSTNNCYPYLDPETDQLYYCTTRNSGSDAVFYRIDLLRNPEYAHELAHFPSEIIPTGVSKPIKRMLNHITLTPDKRKVFIDPQISDGTNTTYYWGLINLYTGEWDQWGSSPDNFTHGQTNPVHEDEALMALDISSSQMYADDGAYEGAGTYKRMWYMKKNWQQLIQPDPRTTTNNYASHEGWAADGDVVYWCSRGMHKRNIRTNAYTTVWDRESSYLAASHCNPTVDMKYWTFDNNNSPKRNNSSYSAYRGCPWDIHFYNTVSKRRIAIYSTRPAITDKSHASNLHPDPHPHFVCNDKYIVCTVAGGTDTPRHNLHWSITPVAQLLEMSK
ncbi:MAG: hypothetical protein J5771_00675 [Bacteroidales bacterium]|nr:hypothetical protein [Bacteroidales bacterium]